MPFDTPLDRQQLPAGSTIDRTFDFDSFALAEAPRRAREPVGLRSPVLLGAVILASALAMSPVSAQQDDFDGDGVPDDTDNCPFISNPTQEDSDGDGIGDACEVVDPDTDGDGIPDSTDPDDDNDGYDDIADNCPVDPNPAQIDFDHDGLGDACDPGPNEPDELAGIIVLADAIVKTVIFSEAPGGTGLIIKLTGRGSVLHKVYNAVTAFDLGLIDVETYRAELERSLNVLEAFDNQLESMIHRGLFDEDEAQALREASESIRSQIEDLWYDAGM